MNSSTTDKLLRLMGYMIIGIAILIVGMAIYIAYQLMFSGGFKQSNNENTRVIMDQHLNHDLNEKNIVDTNNTFPPTDNTATSSNMTSPSYTSPESQIPSYSTYNPFDDDSIPVTEPSNNQPSPSTTNSITSQPTGDIEKAPKPLDPTNKNQQPDLNLLF